MHLPLERDESKRIQIWARFTMEKLTLRIYRNAQGEDITNGVVNRRLGLCDHLVCHLDPEKPISKADLEFTNRYLIHRTEMRYLNGGEEETHFEQETIDKMKQDEGQIWAEEKKRFELKNQIPGLRGLPRDRMAAIEAIIDEYAEKISNLPLSIDEEFMAEETDYRKEGKLEEYYEDHFPHRPRSFMMRWYKNRPSFL